ncbi:MAG: efflux RND transporter periplasmic adaptor subunit [Limisphaerales bacterium]
MSRKQLLIGLAVIAGGVAGFALLKIAHHGGAAEESEPPTATVVAVQVGPLRRATLHGYVEGFGTVIPAPATEGQPPAAARVASPVAGVLAEAHVVEGQQVEKGALLFELDPRTATVAVDRTRRALDYASQTVERQKKLFAAQNTSVRNLRDAEAQLAAAEADLSVAKTQMALLHITAPLSGAVTRVNVKPGEAVDLTATLAEIIDLNRLVVAANIPSAQAGALKPGLLVQVLTEPPVTATLAFVSPAVDATNDTVLVRAPLPPGSAVRPGQFVRLRVVTATHADCLAAPAESVVTDIDGRSVVALVAGDEATQTPVTAGLREGGWVEVEGAGLSPGGTVVTVGAYGLPKQTKVRVVKP